MIVVMQQSMAPLAIRRPMYDTGHTPRHLLACNNIDDVALLLRSDIFIRMRLDRLGVLVGINTHFYNLVWADPCLVQLSEGRRGRRLGDDVDHVEVEGKMLILDEEYKDGRRDRTLNGTDGSDASDAVAWRDDHIVMLCLVSMVLHEKAGYLSPSSPSLQSSSTSLGDKTKPRYNSQNADEQSK